MIAPSRLCDRVVEVRGDEIALRRPYPSGHVRSCGISTQTELGLMRGIRQDRKPGYGLARSGIRLTGRISPSPPEDSRQTDSGLEREIRHRRSPRGYSRSFFTSFLILFSMFSGATVRKLFPALSPNDFESRMV